MHSRRLIRLIQMVLRAKTQPHQTRHQYLKHFDMTQAQFYRDREALSQLGFIFPFSTREKGFMIKKEPVFNISGVSLGQIMALILAVRQQVLSARDDFVLAYGALEALSGIVKALPSKHSKELTNILDQIIVRDGFGCGKDTLDKLQDASRLKTRILVDYQEEKDNPPKRYTADPEQLQFKEGFLFLDAFVAETGTMKSFCVSGIMQVIKTPFLVPRG